MVFVCKVGVGLSGNTGFHHGNTNVDNLLPVDADKSKSVTTSRGIEEHQDNS